jgi:hypothetical protein
MYSYCYVYVFLLLCIFSSGHSVSLCCSLYCLCVKCALYYCQRVSTQLQLTYSSYHIISHHISYHISYHIYHNILYYHFISYHIISYHIISYHIIPYHIIYHVSYHIKSKSIAKFNCTKSLQICDLSVWHLNTAVNAFPLALAVGLNPSIVCKALTVPSWGWIW